MFKLPKIFLLQKTNVALCALTCLLSLCGLCSTAQANTPTVPRILLGIDVLEQMNFEPVKNQRVGLLTHPAGVNRYGQSSIDVLLKRGKAHGVHLVKLFGPEHGIYGNEKANEPIPNQTDARTGLPVYSLYGKYRKPTPEMLAGLDALIIDLQDIGSRSYTYVSAMVYAMEACFEAGVRVVVLDRPNPLGGMKVDGPPLHPTWRSYVGAIFTPYVHGLTIGEIARMAKRENGWLRISSPARKNGQLTIVPMHGYNRNMLWPHTGLKWIPTSPAIPDLSAVLGYPLTGLGTQLGGFRHGYGGPFPFRLLTYPGRSSAQIIRALNKAHLPGLAYKPVTYRDTKGRLKTGVYVQVTDYEKLRPTELSLFMMRLAAKFAAEEGKPNPFTSAKTSHQNLFNKHVGVAAPLEQLQLHGASAQLGSYARKWRKEAAKFQKRSQAIWLYQPVQ